jgi:hypothetical protein
MSIDFKKFLPHILSFGLIVLVNLIYFFPQYQGKTVKQGDIVQVVGMSKEIVDYNKKEGKPVLWTNSMFGGMPSYQISVGSTGNKIRTLQNFLFFGQSAPAGWFIYGMLLFYLTMILLGVEFKVALVGALLFGLSTNNLVLYEAGHTSKLLTIFSSAPIIGGLILAYRNKWLSGGVLFAVGLALNIGSGHVQMTYYLGICLILLTIVSTIMAIKNKDFSNYLKSSAVLLLGAVLALGTATNSLWPTYEYSQDTMRGKPILESKGEPITSSSQVEGLEYQYAMQWSNGMTDLLSSFIPKIAGGGSGEFVGKNTAFAKAIGARKKVQGPMYHGALPFTSGPAYFGVVAFFLFVFGAFAVKGQVKWWLLLVTGLTMLLSMGKYLGGINEFIFNNIPLYNKFRTPNSILSITAVFIPFLAALGLSQLLKHEDKSKLMKPLIYATGILGGIAALVWLLGGSLISVETAGDEQYKQVIDAILDTRRSLISSSAFYALALLMIIAASIYAYIKSKISGNILLAIVGIIGLFDQINIGKDYFGSDDFVSKKAYEQGFEPRPVDTQILQDKALSYRVYDATINTFNAASASYFHKTIGGYHAAKLQRIQDIIDKHISKGNQKVMDMLNTKYYIVPGQDNNPMVQMNPGALGNAWFVSNTIEVSSANGEIDSLTSFNPKTTAVINKEFTGYTKGMTPADSMSNIKLTGYNPDKMEYDVKVNGGSKLAVFSEVWYGPNKGWNAYIDGKPIDHIRVNYLLRGLMIPAGDHKVIFEFKPKSFYTGETLSLICSLLIIASLLAGLFFAFKKEGNESLTTENK